MPLQGEDVISGNLYVNLVNRSGPSHLAEVEAMKALRRNVKPGFRKRFNMAQIFSTLLYWQCRENTSRLTRGKIQHGQLPSIGELSNQHIIFPEAHACQATCNRINGRFRVTPR